jgi:hypothetical protein
MDSAGAGAGCLGGGAYMGRELWAAGADDDMFM